MEWKTGTPDEIEGAVFEVELKNGQTRKCWRVPTLDPCALFFIDGTPEENTYCSPYDIVRWREVK